MNSSNEPLAGTVLGISISSSPDLEALGFSEIQLRDTLIEFSRSMLAAGSTISYGGDLRQEGFGHIFFELASSCKGAGAGDAKRIRNYLAWPLHLDLTAEQQAELNIIAEIVPLPAPEVPGLDAGAFLPPDNAEHSYVWCLSLTRMRERIARDNDAQILMGAPLTGYTGKYPGLVEEAYETMKAGKPLFLIGAFGGCTAAIIDAVRGNRPDSLTEQVQCENEAYRHVLEYFNKHAPADEEQIDYERLLDFFGEKGITGLNNGLSPEENERLFTTPHISEIITLVLQGLKAVRS